MAQRSVVKTTFEPLRVIQPFYTGGSVALSQDGHIFAGQLGEHVLLTDLTTGAELARIEGDGEPITTLSITPSGSHLIVCSRSLSLRVYQLDQTSPEAIEPILVRTLRPHAAPVVVSATDSTSTLLATGGADGVVKIWDIQGGYTTHTFHGHSGVVSALHFFNFDSRSSSPSITKKRQKNSKSQQTEDSEEVDSQLNSSIRLASGGEDGTVRVWNLHKRSSSAVLTCHDSVVRSLDYSPEEHALLSASRDKTAVLCDAQTWKVRRTITALESLEATGFIAEGKIIYTGGETGRLRLWSLSGSELTSEQSAKSETEAILDILRHPGSSEILSVQADQTLHYHSLASIEEDALTKAIPPLPIVRQISGTHDEVIDLAYIGRHGEQLALATNIEDVRIISVAAGSGSGDSLRFGTDLATLKGHEDIVICMDVDWSGHWLATGAKDNTARLWRLDPATDSYQCYATFTGHAGSLGAVTLPRQEPAKDSAAYQDPLHHPPSYLITGSQDKTVKRWTIPSYGEAGRSGKALYTRKAHEKDINALDTNDRGTLFASASQDRTVKIWDVREGEVQGVLRGHKRGVWAVRFAPSGTSGTISGAGQVSSSRGLVLTGSGDKSVRVWSLADYGCLLTLEGHTNSVLKVLWLPSSTNHKQAPQDAKAAQVASAAGDGLVKIWDLGTGEVECTLDNHSDRVWALAAQSRSIADSSAAESSSDMMDLDPSMDPVMLVSGGGDGVLTFWQDVTQSSVLETRQLESQRIQRDQDLSNFIFAKDYRSAIVLALQLDQPGRLLSLFTEIADSKDNDSVTGHKDVDEVIASLSDSQVYRLLLRVRDWNANARTAQVAQQILHSIIKRYPAERLAGVSVPKSDGRARNVSLSDLYSSIMAYTDRHLKRVDEMLEQSYLLDFTLQEMDGVGGQAIEPAESSHLLNGITNGFS